VPHLRIDEAPGLVDRGVSLQEYLPRAPIEGKLRSVALLDASLHLDGAPAPVRHVFEVASEVLGAGEAVWRVRSGRDGSTSWELYLWDHARRAPIEALGLLLGELRLHVVPGLDLEAIASLGPLCCSIDLPGALDEAELRAVNVYVRLERATVSYFRVDASGALLQGVQTRFEGEAGWAAFNETLARMPHLAGLAGVSAVVPEQLRGAPWVYLTQTPRHVGVYLAGLDLGAFEWFLEHVAFASGLVGFVRDERARLDHLRFDVGYGVRAVDGGVELGSAGVYAAL
jgi:hypothetical protein